MIEILVTIFAVLGTFLLVIASLGVLRMPDFYHRIHPPTKSATFGLAFLLLAIALDVPDVDTITKAILAFLFINLTAPVAIHILCRTAYREGLPSHKPMLMDEYASVAEKLRQRRGRSAPSDVPPETQEEIADLP